MLESMETSDKIYFTGLASLALGIIIGCFTGLPSGEIKRFNYLSNGRATSQIRNFIR